MECAVCLRVFVCVCSAQDGLCVLCVCLSLCVCLCVVHKMEVTVKCYLHSLCIDCMDIVGTVRREEGYCSSGMCRLGSYTVCPQMLSTLAVWSICHHKSLLCAPPQQRIE